MLNITYLLIIDKVRKILRTLSLIKAQTRLVTVSSLLQVIKYLGLVLKVRKLK